MQLTILFSPNSISGAIHPSVPVVPDFFEKEILPFANFLHMPKSDIKALISPEELGIDIKTFCGLISRCTKGNKERK